MALTISIEGKGVIANSDATTNDTGGTATGDWVELGGGSISLSTETYLRGTNCVAGAYSNKAGWHYFDIGAGNELDFDTAGSEEGQFFYFPIFNPTPGLNELTANGGLRIQLGSSTTDYREYMILSGDDFNGWNGSWKTFVLDPTKAGSVTDTGTFDVGAIRQIGIYVDATALAKGDNIFIDQISVGTGLRITGTSTTGWQDAVAYCTDYPNRAWGMLEQRGDVIYAKGKIYIGDSTQGSATSFADSGQVIQFEESEYWSGSAWVSTLPTTACGIVLEDAAGFATTFSDGVVVGTDNGRSGSTIIGNDNENVSIDFSGLSNAGSVVNLYGTTFKSIYGAITGEADADHKYYGCSFIDSSQFVPAGAPVIRNCTFAETTDTDAALLWNASINIQNSKFIANTTGAGIEHPSTGSFTYTGLTFSGNTYDVLNSSGSGISISVSGAGAASSSEGSAVTFLSSVDIDVHVEDSGGVDIESAQVYIQKSAVGKQWNYTSHATNNAVDDITFEVNEVVDADLPQAGWLHVWDASSNTKQNYQYASWTGKIFTLKTKIGTIGCTGGGTGVLLQDDTTSDFTAIEIAEGDTVRNETDGSWAVVDEITDADNITTTQLQGGSDNTWTSGDNYSFHSLAILYNASDKIDIPLLNDQTDSSGDVSGSYNWGAIGVELPIKVRIRSNQGSPKYIPFNTSASITGDGRSLTAVLSDDEVAT